MTCRNCRTLVYWHQAILIRKGSWRKGGLLSETGGHFCRPPTERKGGGPMAIVSLICSIISAGCAVFGVIFSIYLHQQQHHNDDNKK